MATITEVSRVHLDPGRITAGAGAIALNGLLLMLLLVPVAAPPILRAVREEPPIFIIERPEPPPPVTPIPVEVKRPTHSAVEPRAIERPAVQSPTHTTDDPQPADVVVPPGDGRVLEVAADPVLPPDDGRPMEGAHLEYAVAPPPAYPRDALRDGLTGVVMLKVLVDVDGTPLEVTVERSSGHRVLDVAARRQVLAKWRFRPAMRNGQPVQAIGRVPVEFALD